MKVGNNDEWRGYMREYAKRPEVRKKVNEYQKWYKCTDVYKSYRAVMNARCRLKTAERNGDLLKLIAAKQDLRRILAAHKLTLESCGAIRGQWRKNHGNPEVQAD